MEFLTWEQLTVVEQLKCNFSDLHKDVRGFRPRWPTIEQWNSEEWLTQAIAALCDEAEAAWQQEQDFAKEAIAAFEKRVAATIALGAPDRDTAVRWLFDAEEEGDVINDPDYYCYLYGLPYGYFRKAA